MGYSQVGYHTCLCLCKCVQVQSTVASESADMNIQYREKAANPNIVFEMVFHNNGNLCGSWVDNEDILLEYKGV